MIISAIPPDEYILVASKGPIATGIVAAEYVVGSEPVPIFHIGL